MVKYRYQFRFNSLIQAQSKELSVLRRQLNKTRNTSRYLETEFDNVSQLLNCLPGSGDGMLVPNVVTKLDRCKHLTKKLKEHLKEWVVDGSETNSESDGMQKKGFTNIHTLMLLRKDQELKEKQAQIVALENKLYGLDTPIYSKKPYDHEFLSGILTPASSRHSMLTTEDEMPASTAESTVSQSTEYALLPKRRSCSESDKSSTQRRYKSLPMYQRTIAVTEYLPSKNTDSDASINGTQDHHDSMIRNGCGNCTVSYGGSWNTLTSTRKSNVKTRSNVEDLVFPAESFYGSVEPGRFDNPYNDEVDTSCQNESFSSVDNSRIKDAERRKLRKELGLNIETYSRFEDGLNEEMDASRDLVHSIKSETSFYEKIHKNGDIAHIYLTDGLMTPPPSASSSSKDCKDFGFKFSPASEIEMTRKSHKNLTEYESDDTRPYYNPQGPYVLGNISQFNELKQKISSTELVSRKVISTFKNIFSNLELHDYQSPEIDLSTMNRGLEVLQKQINYSGQLLNKFWPASMVTSYPQLEMHNNGDRRTQGNELRQDDNASENSVNSEADDLREEVNKLQKRLSTQDKLLHSTLMRLQTANRMKEGIEHEIIRQLTMTHNVLKKARGNLQNQSKQESRRK